MKLFLKSISTKLKNFSLSLDKKSILVEQPWAMIDDQFEIQKLIFKNNGDLILSKNGIVSKGTWEYLPAAKCLLIDRGSDTILCNEQYIDNTVMILKLDGTKNEYFALANESHLPDLDVKRYMVNKLYNKKDIHCFKSDNGQLIGIENSWGTLSYDDPLNYKDLINKSVYIDGYSVDNGTYSIRNTTSYEDNDHLKKYIIIVEDGMITNVEYITKIICKNNIILYSLVRNRNFVSLRKGDKVYLDEQLKKPAPDGNYKLFPFRKIIVENGVIV